ncbi:MAG: DUF4136 domain-containing protein [Sulfurimonas sp.]|nr:DUF4136 domain-containing protein [Sulfurimonas sp.]
MKKWILALITIFIISGCSTLQVQVDSDPEYNYTELNKFNVIYTKKDDEKNFMRSRLNKSLINYFKNKGYTYSEKKDADFYIIFHLDVQKRSEMETNYQEMGMNPRADYYNHISYANDGKIYLIDPFPRSMSSVTTTRTYEYEEGRFVVEILDVKQNAVFWQSIAEDEISDTTNSQEQKSAYINNVLEKMFSKFPEKISN